MKWFYRGALVFWMVMIFQNGKANELLFPTLPLEYRQKHIETVQDQINQRWEKVKEQWGDFTPFRTKSDEAIHLEFNKIKEFREQLWYRNPKDSPRVSNMDYLVSQDILAEGYLRAMYNIAFDYNNTDKSYNASTVLINGRHFIALQEPSAPTLSKFFKLLINHQAPILVRLNPMCEFKGKGSIKYWEERMVNSSQGTLLKLDVPDSIIPVEPVYIRYFYTEMWPDNQKLEIKELYCLVQQVRSAYSNLKYKGPLAVHCASGVSRTGTFIATLVLADLLDRYPCDEISIEEIVLKLSIERPNMVGVADQYVMLYRFVEYYLSRKREKVASEFKKLSKD